MCCTQCVVLQLRFYMQHTKMSLIFRGFSGDICYNHNLAFRQSMTWHHFRILNVITVVCILMPSVLVASSPKHSSLFCCLSYFLTLPQQFLNTKSTCLLFIFLKKLAACTLTRTFCWTLLDVCWMFLISILKNWIVSTFFFSFSMTCNCHKSTIYNSANIHTWLHCICLLPTGK